METGPHRTLERLISHRALEMSSNVSCKVGVVCFLCGVCASYLLLAAVTSFSGLDIESVASPAPLLGKAEEARENIGLIASNDGVSLHGWCDYLVKKVDGDLGFQGDGDLISDGRMWLLYCLWESLLNVEGDEERLFLTKAGLDRTNMPPAPHMESCQSNTEIHDKLDQRGPDGSFPPWRNWRESLGLRQILLREEGEQKSAYPPWIIGSDEDNLPLTRKVQQDIWMHQHPRNCSDPDVRFLVAVWEVEPGFGLGAQISGMCGLLAIAIIERRVLVTNYFNRADHDGCKGPSRSRWSCYFVPEVSVECRNQAMRLLNSQIAWSQDIVRMKENYTSRTIWAGPVPRNWGTPWDELQPPTEVNGNLLKRHHKMDKRWWRSQSGIHKPQSDMESYVWAYQRPWMPRPLLSLHVRMGDKASEMKIVGFDTYMQIADRVRRRFPNLRDIWLSTEMQEVVDQLHLYPKWNFYYTKVARQEGNVTMAAYEASLGRETSTNYPLVNFLMAADADFFIGALGSTWCYLIDGMRNTAGKMMAGYLSVNKDRFW